MKSGLKGKFYGQIDVEFVNGNLWRLLQLEGKEFGMEIEGVGKLQPEKGFEVGPAVAAVSSTITVRPKPDFLFDFASIPPPARWIYPKTGSGKDGQYGPAAVIHDWLYSFPTIDGTSIKRELADRIFLCGMETNNVRWSMRNLFYAAVRAGGWAYFGKPEKLNRLRGAK